MFSDPLFVTVAGVLLTGVLGAVGALYRRILSDERRMAEIAAKAAEEVAACERRLGAELHAQQARHAEQIGALRGEVDSHDLRRSVARVHERCDEMSQQLNTVQGTQTQMSVTLHTIHEYLLTNRSD